jgi:Cof subfamily protein (haloacid dehalogenase superfamily)
MIEGLPRMLVCDIDGTLIPVGGQIPQRNREAIEALKDAGVTVVLASGRILPAMASPCRRLGLGNLHIAMHGAVIGDPVSGAIGVYHKLDERDVRAHVSFANDLGLPPILCYPDGLRTDRHYRELEDQFLHFDEPTPLAATIEELVAAGPTKTVVQTGRERYEEVKALAEERFGGRYEITSAQLDSVELLPLGVNKGAALKQVAERLGIDPGEVVAVGDGPNDVEMLRFAATSVAMSHSADEVRRAATHVIDPPTDAEVADAITYLFPGLIESRCA